MRANTKHEQRRRRRRSPRAAPRRRSASSSRKRCRSGRSDCWRRTGSRKLTPIIVALIFGGAARETSASNGRPEIHEADALHGAVQHRPDPRHSARREQRSRRRGTDSPLPQMNEPIAILRQRGRLAARARACQFHSANSSGNATGCWPTDRSSRTTGSGSRSRRRQIGMLLEPDRQDVGELIVSDVGKHDDRHGADQRRDRLAFVARQRRGCRARFAFDPRRQIAIAAQIGRKRAEHEQRRGAEPDMPAIALPQKAAQQRPGDRAEIDRGAEDREAARAARLVVGRIDAADLRRDVPLEQPGADDQQQQRDQEAWSKAMARWPPLIDSAPSTTALRWPMRSPIQPPSTGVK